MHTPVLTLSLPSGRDLRGKQEIDEFLARKQTRMLKDAKLDCQPATEWTFTGYGYEADPLQRCSSHFAQAFLKLWSSNAR